jgi:hypothetical protein
VDVSTPCFFGWVPRSTQAIGKQFKKADAGSAERRKGFVGVFAYFLNTLLSLFQSLF